jgi:hypothetical protein
MKERNIDKESIWWNSISAEKFSGQFYVLK